MGRTVLSNDHAVAVLVHSTRECSTVNPARQPRGLPCGVHGSVRRVPLMCVEPFAYAQQFEACVGGAQSPNVATYLVVAVELSAFGTGSGTPADVAPIL